MSKRVNYNGEPSKRTKYAKKPTAKQFEQLQKNSGEKKGMDTVLTLNPVITTVNTNASAFTLNLVRPGNASYNRVGRKIYNKSLRLMMDLICEVDDIANLIYGNTLRMVVVWDKQPQGAVPTYDDIFGYTDQAGTETCVFNSPPKYDNMNRFQVLRDKAIECRPMAAMANIDTQYRFHIDEYIKLGNRTTVYSGQSSPCTIADIASGGLYVYFRAAKNDSQSLFQITANSIARLRYSD